MTTITKAIIGLALIATAMAPQAVQGESVSKTMRAADVPDLQQFLPPLPADLPWLALNSRAPARSVVATRNAATLPEAGSINALLLVPKPAEAWQPSASQSAAAAAPEDESARHAGGA